MDAPTKFRLDQLLVDHHGYETRSRARDAILRGCVKLDGKIITKPGQTVSPAAEISIADEAFQYVSRAALKLLHALELSGIDPRGKIALDLGASTGGFSQVLLERDAKRIFAIDVGSDQLHPSLRDNAILTNIENKNVRTLEPSDLGGEKPTLIVCDLSFISLKLALPAALELAAENAEGIFLIKPQFEVGKKGLGSGGIVRDEHLIDATVNDLRMWLDGQPGWQVERIAPSPIIGGDGNKEFLMIAKRSGAKEGNANE